MTVPAAATAAPLSPALLRYVTRGALHAALAQDALVDLTSALPPHNFAVDMAAGTLSFVPHDGSPGLTFRAHLIASLAPGPRSALWGWAHPRGDEVSALLKAAGERDGVPELCAPEAPFPEHFPRDLSAEPAALGALAHHIANAAVGITGRAPYYSATSGRSRAVFVLDTPIEVSVQDLLVKMPRMLANAVVDDARAALEGIAEARGWTLENTETGISVTDGTTVAHFELDENEMISRISGKIPGKEPAQEEESAA
jgi:hypothetical protein